MGYINFTKMVASGNDFVVIDNRSGILEKLSIARRDIALRICCRRKSVGADGLLLIENSKKSDFKMRIFNPDGSEVSMCGNGSRCAALYAVENKITGKTAKIKTAAGELEAEVIGLAVKVKMTNPKDMKLNLDLSLGGKKIKSHLINTGVPHVVSFVKNLGKLDVDGMGRKIRRHKKFSPKGTNADFVKIVNSKTIKIRTYERGVEAETLACGTGAAASAIIAGVVKGLKPHIDVITKSGEMLRIYFEFKKNKTVNVYLEGEAMTVYSGRFNYV